ncbi:MAG: glutamine amidotransferase [Anaerolineae bacterium]|nr:glutamine amidotransferase [Anaerolineae bacterium]
MLAESGGGRYYPALSMEDVPQIFVKEAMEAVGSYIVEEPFYPLPAGTTDILRGIDPLALPPLLGYNGTTPKQTAHVALVSERGDPLLAQWQYGLGRAVAWTSDLKGQWAVEWVGWERFNAFVAQLVGWTLPRPDESLQVTTRLDGAEVHLKVDSADQSGRPRDLLETRATLVGPRLVTQTVPLEQTAAGRYEGRTTVSEPGTYLIHIVQYDTKGEPVAQQTAGLVVPYSPEYQRTGQGTTLLNELVRATGGRVLEAPEMAFAPMHQPVTRARPLWPALLLTAALLFPFDVGARRLRITKADLRSLGAWIRERIPRRGKVAQRWAGPVVLGDLFQARERARRRGPRPSEGAGAVPHLTPPPQPPVAAPSPPSAAEAEEDTLARLRRARERARRR